jgi:hypothetical protein
MADARVGGLWLLGIALGAVRLPIGAINVSDCRFVKT